MDKQKQIEEMAKSCKNCIHYNICSLWSTTDIDEEESYKYCYGNYQPKIPEDAVVLTREESLQELRAFAKNVTERVRKETAEKFAERLKQDFDSIDYIYDDIHNKYLCFKDVLDKIDEICKEITEGGGQ